MPCVPRHQQQISVTSWRAVSVVFAALRPLPSFYSPVKVRGRTAAWSDVNRRALSPSFRHSIFVFSNLEVVRHLDQVTNASCTSSRCSYGRSSQHARAAAGHLAYSPGSAAATSPWTQAEQCLDRVFSSVLGRAGWCWNHGKERAGAGSSTGWFEQNVRETSARRRTAAAPADFAYARASIIH